MVPLQLVDAVWTPFLCVNSFSFSRREIPIGLALAILICPTLSVCATFGNTACPLGTEMHLNLCAVLGSLWSVTRQIQTLGSGASSPVVLTPELASERMSPDSAISEESQTVKLGLR